MPFSQVHDTGTVRVGALSGALRPRILGLAESFRGPSWCAILLETGGADIAGDDRPVSGPALVWHPWTATSRVRFEAGAVGTYVLLNASALANAIGHMRESRDLRDAADHPVRVPLNTSPQVRAILQSAFAGIRSEIETEAIAGHVIVEAFLRVILVEVLRSALARSSSSRAASPSHRVFTRFSTLVERHFRERWTVNDYARTLGVTRDRLGDMCRRVRGLNPKDVIDRRVMLEARLLLETSGRSVNEIAGSLGFSSAAQFNRFFAHHADQPPGAYRASYLRGSEDGVSDPARPFDWP